MVRGVNKKVVEVIDLEHEYFEKAILFVKEAKQEREDRLLRQEAGRYLKTLHYHPTGRKRLNRYALSLLKLGGAAAVGATIMSLVR